MIVLVVLLIAASGAGLWLFVRLSRQTPILMYHRVADIPGDTLTVSPELFARQMDYLSSRGYHAISLSQLVDHLTEGRPLPHRPVVLTFDDAYEDCMTGALPVLTRQGMVGAVFPITGWIGRENGWEDYPGKPERHTMTVRQLMDWMTAGMEVGSHTVSHPRLSKLTDAEIEDELAKSKRTLEELLGKPVEFLCYPYGDFDSRVQSAARKAGYRAAFAIYEGAHAIADDLFALRRVRIYQTKPFRDFRFKVSRLHGLNLALHILTHRWSISQIRRR